MNGRVSSDFCKGKYTFVGHRGRSVVDYVLAKADRPSDNKRCLTSDALLTVLGLDSI